MCEVNSYEMQQLYNNRFLVSKDKEGEPDKNSWFLSQYAKVALFKQFIPTQHHEIWKTKLREFSGLSTISACTRNGKSAMSTFALRPRLRRCMSFIMSKWNIFVAYLFLLDPISYVARVSVLFQHKFTFFTCSWTKSDGSFFSMNVCWTKKSISIWSEDQYLKSKKLNWLGIKYGHIAVVWAFQCFFLLHLHETVEVLYFYFSLSVCLCVCVCPALFLWTKFQPNECTNFDAIFAK